MTSLNLLILLTICICVSNGFFVPGRNGPQPYLVAPMMVGDLEEGGWQMIFRATSGNGEDVYNAWTQGTGVSTQKPVDMGRSYAPHYRDPRVMHWGHLNIQYIKLALYKQSQEVAYIVFDGLNSTNTSWFNGSRVEAASWSDLHKHHAFNYFSIRGHTEGALERSFFINSHYGGCDQDLGHMVVLEHKGTCPWEDESIFPAILYSDMNGAEYWARREFGHADYLAIFISTEHVDSIIG